jgi:hypothetical protein
VRRLNTTEPGGVETQTRVTVWTSRKADDDAAWRHETEMSDFQFAPPKLEQGSGL